MVSDRLLAWIRQHFEVDDVESIVSLLAEAVPGEPGETMEVLSVSKRRLSSCLAETASGSFRR